MKQRKKYDLRSRIRFVKIVLENVPFCLLFMLLCFLFSFSPFYNCCCCYWRYCCWCCCTWGRWCWWRRTPGHFPPRCRPWRGRTWGNGSYVDLKRRFAFARSNHSKHWECDFTFWKCNFPMTRHVLLLVVWVVGRSVIGAQ